MKVVFGLIRVTKLMIMTNINVPVRGSTILLQLKSVCQINVVGVLEMMLLLFVRQVIVVYGIIMAKKLLIPQITNASAISTILLVSSNVFSIPRTDLFLPTTSCLLVKILMLIGVGRMVNVLCPDPLRGVLRK